jgi:coatomer protein complex subunit gamma
MSALSYKKNDDIDNGALDKMTVYQECSSGFNSSPIQAKKARILLTKLVHLMSTGETFPAEEATSLFFSITKLFQHKDPSLRQMVYVAIKDLALSANDVIMVTSSIMKDVQSSSDNIYKPNAIRALIRIIDASIVQNIERLMKTAIADKHPSVSSAALVSSYHLIPISKEVVKRWANDAQDSLSAPKAFPSSFSYNHYSVSPSFMYQYHAIGLLYLLRSHDKMALMKLIQQYGTLDGKLRNPNALVMIIRFIARIIDEDPNLHEPLLKILQDFLRHKSDIVNLEASKIILQLKKLTAQEAQPAVLLLKSFLGSPRTVARFSAIRILNRYAMRAPQNVVSCNVDIENLINDPSRSIATYAITTLLKTGDEVSVDRLMSQISGFMNDITDEFKIIVIDAIRSLALKFPSKHQRMLSFLAGGLRDEGGITYKTAVVEALFDMIRYIPASKDAALGHLCELVEDCEFTELSVRILHLLGTDGPSTASPTVYIRYIYNRVVLENALIRAAAVTALSKFALVDDPHVQKSIKVLLTRCLDDVTDEVRDRAALALRLISLDKEEATNYIAPKTQYSLPQLESQLALYVSGDKAQFSTPFDINTVPRITEEQARAQAFELKSKATEVSIKSEKPEEQISSATEQQIKDDNALQEYAATLSAIPEFQSYGSLLKSSKPTPLTESETEYVVTAVKHFFKDHLVIQYNVSNTLDEYVLENVVVEVQGDFEEDFTIPIDRLAPGSEGIIYVSFSRPQEFFQTSLYNNLKFISKEIDPETNEEQDEGYDDDYNLENLDITAGDYLVPSYVGNFTYQWDELSNEVVHTFQLGHETTIEEAAQHVISSLSLMPLESSDVITSQTSHTLKLYGKTITGEKVAATGVIVSSSQTGVVLRLKVRAEDESISELVAEAIGA